MLYDPKWEVKTKPEPMSVEGLIAWLEKRPAEGTYNWEDCNGSCLIGLYGAAHRIGEEWRTFHSKLFEADQLFIASHAPHTFGAALKRAKNVHLGRAAVRDLR